MKRIMLVLIGLAIAASVGAGNVQAAVYEIDPAHSTIGFAVKHLVVSTTRGQFDQYTSNITYDSADLSSFSADVVIEANGINTNNEKRDAHLKSADFFDVENFPTITFKGKAISKNDEGGLTIAGDLTIKGVTKAIEIPVTIEGPIQSPQGFSAIGIAGEVSINRQDFGITWNKTLDSGGLMVADNVRLLIEIEAHSAAE